MNPILLGKTEVRPVPRVGDVCRMVRDGKDFGLWVPFAGNGGRSDGDRVRYHSWSFARFGAPDDHKSFQLHEVSAIEIPCEDECALNFWKRLQPFIR